MRGLLDSEDEELLLDEPIYTSDDRKRPQVEMLAERGATFLKPEKEPPRSARGLAHDTGKPKPYTDKWFKVPVHAAGEGK